jgi:hypothetical protein
MNKDAELIAEAYINILEKKAHKGKKPDKDGDGVPDWADKHHGKDDNASKNKKGKLSQAENRERFKQMVAGKKKKSVNEENEEMGQAYQTILEFKHINKKFARRYNKVTAAMLKAQPGSEEYGKLKSEREDLVTILKDHGQTPQDLEAFLVKKEKENPLPEVQDPQSMNQYQDNSYSDTADISSQSDDYEPSMHASQAEVAQMPPDAPTAQEVQAIAQQ